MDGGAGGGVVAGVTAVCTLAKAVLDLVLLYMSRSQGREEAGLNEDISFIKDEFEMMVSYLMDASEGHGHKNSATRTWIRQVHDLAYDVEDHFQEFVVHLEKPPRLPSKSRKTVVDKIGGLKERIHQINQRYKRIQNSRQPDNSTSTTGGVNDQHKVLMETVDFEGQPEMFEQAKRILCKCNGLPLAIDTIAGFLATRPKTAPEWKKFIEQFSFEFEKNPSLEMIRTVLSSDSEALPYHLKLCFLYLSTFPNDQNIRRRRLVRRWIAEGYSYGTHNSTAEENGEGYFAELISRSIIQASESVAGSGASIDYCHVHNLLHEISVWESAKEKFSILLHSHSNLQSNDTIRHLSIQSSWKRDEDQLKSIGNLSQLRSLTVCGEWQSFFILEGMGMIRVLDLEGASGLNNHHVKHMITKLIHLKYLCLRGCVDVFNLPGSLGNLSDLQTLDVRGTHIILLPATIVKLQKLQYLRAGLIPEDERVMQDGMTAPVRTLNKFLTKAGTLKLTAAMLGHLSTLISHDDAINAPPMNILRSLGLDIHGVVVPNRLGNLINSLHTLGVVNLSAANGKAASTELGKASQMRKLGVTGIKRDNSQQFFSAISKLIHLESLSIRSEGKPGLQDCLDCKSSSPPRDLRSLKLYGNLVTLPAWVSRLQHLAKLKLRSTRLGQEAIHVMGQLPLLKLLCLLHNAVEAKDQDLRFHFKSGSFPALVLLQLDGLPDLRSVEFEQNAATKLELLQVKGCNNMDKDGCSGLSFLQSLKEVSLEAGHG